MSLRTEHRNEEEAEEHRLKNRLNQLPPGTKTYQAAAADLADFLLDKGETGKAKQIFSNALLGKASKELTQRQTKGQASLAGARSSPPRTPSASDNEDWENGEWESGLGNLSLSTRPPKPDSNGASSPVPSKGRMPNSKRPSRMLFVPSRQQSATSLASSAADDESREDSPEQAALLSPPKAVAATPEVESSMPSHALQPNTLPKSESHRPRPPARSQLAKLQKQGDFQRGDFPQGLDPPGLKDSQTQPIPYEGRHILEIVGLKTTDGDTQLNEYVTAIKEFPIRPVIRWADDTHALIVFSEIQEAAYALEHAPEIGRLWLKPYEQASAPCRQVAASELHPPTSRPKTTAVVAKRLLFNALNNREILDLDGEREIRSARREKIAEKARRQAEIDAAWGDD